MSFSNVNLSNSFEYARSLVDGFQLHNGHVDPMALQDAFFTNLPMEQPVNPTINKLIERRQKRKQFCISERETFYAVLGTSDINKRKRELEHYVEMSQEVQRQAIIAGINLLSAYSEDLKDIAGRFMNTIVSNWKLILDKISYLKEIHTSLTQIGLPFNASNELRKAIESIISVYGYLAHNMQNDADLIVVYKNLGKTSSDLLAATRIPELINEPNEKHHILFVIKTATDFIFDCVNIIAKSATPEGRFAKFLFDYGSASIKFYYAANMIDEILTKIDDTNSLNRSMEMNVVLTTNRIKNLNAEIDRLKNAKGEVEQKKVIYELRQKDAYDAQLAGDWFSQRSGISAPGHPL